MFCGLREKELRLPSPTSRGVILIGKPHLFHIFQRLTVTETQICTLWSASQDPMQSGLCHLSDPHFLLLTLLTQLQLHWSLFCALNTAASFMPEGLRSCYAHCLKTPSAPSSSLAPCHPLGLSSNVTSSEAFDDDPIQKALLPLPVPLHAIL